MILLLPVFVFFFWASSVSPMTVDSAGIPNKPPRLFSIPVWIKGVMVVLMLGAILNDSASTGIKTFCVSFMLAPLAFGSMLTISTGKMAWAEFFRVWFFEQASCYLERGIWILIAGLLLYLFGIPTFVIDILDSIDLGWGKEINDPVGISAWGLFACALIGSQKLQLLMMSFRANHQKSVILAFLYVIVSSFVIVNAYNIMLTVSKESITPITVICFATGVVFQFLLDCIFRWFEVRSIQQHS